MLLLPMQNTCIVIEDGLPTLVVAPLLPAATTRPMSWDGQQAQHLSKPPTRVGAIMTDGWVDETGTGLWVLPQELQQLAILLPACHLGEMVNHPSCTICRHGDESGSVLGRWAPSHSPVFVFTPGHPHDVALAKAVRLCACLHHVLDVRRAAANRLGSRLGHPRVEMRVGANFHTSSHQIDLDIRINSTPEAHSAPSSKTVWVGALSPSTSLVILVLLLALGDRNLSLSASCRAGCCSSSSLNSMKSSSKMKKRVFPHASRLSCWEASGPWA